jgi:hypothetical protein
VRERGELGEKSSSAVGGRREELGHIYRERGEEEMAGVMLLMAINRGR